MAFELDAAPPIMAESCIANILRDCLLMPLAEAVARALLDRAKPELTDNEHKPAALLLGFRSALHSANLDSELDPAIASLMSSFHHDGCFGTHLDKRDAIEGSGSALWRQSNELMNREMMRVMLARSFREWARDADWKALLRDNAEAFAPDARSLAALARDMKRAVATTDIAAFMQRQRFIDSYLFDWLLIRFDQRLGEAIWMRSQEARRRQALIDGLVDLPLE